MNGSPDESKPPKVRVIETQAVPVHNCQVYLRRISGGYVARVANLDDLQVEAPNQREALQRVVEQFKARIAEHVAEGDPIPWREPPSVLEADESERLIAVHL